MRTIVGQIEEREGRLATVTQPWSWTEQCCKSNEQFMTTDKMERIGKLVSNLYPVEANDCIIIKMSFGMFRQGSVEMENKA